MYSIRRQQREKITFEKNEKVKNEKSEKVKPLGSIINNSGWSVLLKLGKQGIYLDIIIQGLTSYGT
jgi:hypothetical protein